MLHEFYLCKNRVALNTNKPYQAFDKFSQLLKCRKSFKTENREDDRKRQKIAAVEVYYCQARLNTNLPKLTLALRCYLTQPGVVLESVGPAFVIRAEVCFSLITRSFSYFSCCLERLDKWMTVFSFFRGVRIPCLVESTFKRVL